MPSDGQQEDLEQVTEGSPFVRLLETKARVKMLDVLLRHSYASLSEEEIAERAGLNQSSVNRNIEVFEDLGVVQSESNWPVRYQVDTSSSVVEGLEQAQLNLLEHSERLTADDVKQRDDQKEWIPIEDLSDGDLRILISELNHHIGFTVKELHPDDDDGLPGSLTQSPSPPASRA